MSFKAPRLPRTSRASSQSFSRSRGRSTLFPKCHPPHESPNHRLILPSDVPKMRHSYGMKGHVRLHNNEVLAEPFGHIFVQQPAPPQALTAAIPCQLEPASDDPFVDMGDAEPLPIYVLDGGDDFQVPHQRQRRKRERQWLKWANETIPSLLQPYLQILCESNNLCTLDYFSDIISPGCSCERWVTINVTCIFFERKLFYFHLFNIYQHNSVGLESMQIHYCQCYPAALQLLRHGLFPCTPTAPTLAVDLKMLEFACKLFLRVAPNNTAWCDMVESILGGRKYKLTTRVSY